MEADFEKLGLFYLGAPFDLDAGARQPGLVLYDSRHLLTHGLCVGMTGSGKTGLGVCLLEEAAIDGIPALVIDPKGDLGNLLLTFPDLSPEEFLPWVEPEKGARKGMSVEELAAREAETWREGLASWGQGPERIRRLREAARPVIYTPGSSAGRPLAVLSSLAAPPGDLARDSDLLAERVASTAGSLLGLLGLPADAVRSRDHVLLANILDTCWREGRDLDLAGLIQLVQAPPFSRMGVLELESFYPARERFELAMTLNNLLAAPSFGPWLEGDPLDLDRMLYGPDGRPRIAICSIAHLGEKERMFFVSLLLNQLLGWVRLQRGTSELRALVYMDEIFGFLPPVAEPPSKRPLLTLLKQARAYGVGVMLATQNPVDVDYKALSNMGTWILGRLQTDQDKQRLLDGLEGAAGGTGLSRRELDDLLSRLPGRTFLLHDVHEDRPLVFQSRWALSYLRGPLTREEIRRLAGGGEAETRPLEEAAAPGAPGEVPDSPSAAPPGAAPPAAIAAAPVLPPEVPVRYLPAGDGPRRPYLAGFARVRYDGRALEAPFEEEVALAVPLEAELAAGPWEGAEEVEWSLDDLSSEPPPAGAYPPLAPSASDPASYPRWRRELQDHLYRRRELVLLRSPSLGLVSRPGEGERELRIRLAGRAREERGRRLDELRGRYGKSLDRLEQRRARAEQHLAVQRQQASHQKVQTVISVGATMLTALLGRKRLGTSTLGRATTAMRGAGRVQREAQDVTRAEQRLDAVLQEIQALEQELEDEIRQLDTGAGPETEPLERVTVRAKKTDVEVRQVALVWR